MYNNIYIYSYYMLSTKDTKKIYLCFISIYFNRFLLSIRSKHKS